MSLSIQKHLKEFLPMIDEEIKKMIPSDSYPNLYDGMDYAISSGGKRLRPTICLLACDALGGDVSLALPVAAGIEIIHNATLVHDDIEDGDKLRRGKQTVWSKFSTPHATNIGDAMIFKAYESILNSQVLDIKKTEITSELTKTLVEVTEGQNMEFNFRERNDVTTEEYLKMARKKAGVLVGLSLAVGANVADASKDTQSLLYNFGSDIGLAFMIRDDILNLVGDEKKYGKEIGGDIKEGKRTLIIIDCLSKCNDDEKKKLLKILKKTRANVSTDDTTFVTDLVKKYDSIEFAQKHSENLVKDAKEKLNSLKNEKLKQALNELSDFMIKREF